MITRFRPQAGQYLRRVDAPECGRKGVALGFTVVPRSPPVRREPPLHDRAIEQPIAAGRHQMQTDAETAGRLTGNRDAIRIATKGGDMRTHPFERQTLIEKAVIAGRAEALASERPVAEEPEGSKSIVGRDDDHVVRFDESGGI